MEKDRTFQMRVDNRWIELIDDWRRKEAVKRKADLSRSEAVREIVAERLSRADKA